MAEEGQTGRETKRGEKLELRLFRLRKEVKYFKLTPGTNSLMLL